MTQTGMDTPTPTSPASTLLSGEALADALRKIPGVRGYVIRDGRLHIWHSPSGEAPINLNAAVRIRNDLANRYDDDGWVFIPQACVALTDDPNDFSHKIPDIAVYRRSQLQDRDAEIWLIRAIPPLVIEIVSPSNDVSDPANYMDAYRKRGVPHVWLIDRVNETAEGWELQNGAYQLAGKDKDGAFALPPFAETPIAFKDLPRWG